MVHILIVSPDFNLPSDGIVELKLYTAHRLVGVVGSCPLKALVLSDGSITEWLFI